MIEHTPYGPQDQGKVLAFFDNSARDKAQRRFEATGIRTNPWTVNPTRESYTETVRFQREGVTLESTRTVHQWTTQCVEDPWSEARPLHPREHLPFNPQTDTVLAYFDHSNSAQAERLFGAPLYTRPETYTRHVRFQRDGLILEACQQVHRDAQGKLTEGSWSATRPALEG
jgi:hypothetical protein